MKEREVQKNIFRVPDLQAEYLGLPLLFFASFVDLSKSLKLSEGKKTKPNSSFSLKSSGRWERWTDILLAMGQCNSCYISVINKVLREQGGSNI